MDFPTPVQPVTRMKVAKTFNAPAAQGPGIGPAGPDTGPAAGSSAARTAARPRTTPRSGGCARRSAPTCQCPDREDHARWGERYAKLDRETATLRRRIERTNTIARQFDRVRRAGGPGLPEAQRRAVVADLQRAGPGGRGVPAAGRLGGPGAARPGRGAVRPCSRAQPDDAEPPRIPGGAVREALSRMVSIWGDLDALEREHRVSFLREPDLGFAWAAYRWPRLEDVLDDVDLALATSCVGSSSCSTWESRSPTLPGTRPCAGPPATPSGRCAEWWPTRPRSTPDAADVSARGQAYAANASVTRPADEPRPQRFVSSATVADRSSVRGTRALSTSGRSRSHTTSTTVGATAR